MADLARQMYRDCTYDLKEIAQCRDCYRFAVEKPTKYWFCKPCRPFHELVCNNNSSTRQIVHHDMRMIFQKLIIC